MLRKVSIENSDHYERSKRMNVRLEEAMPPVAGNHQ
jgi:hypothetical protein